MKLHRFTQSNSFEFKRPKHKFTLDAILLICNITLNFLISNKTKEVPNLEFYNSKIIQIYEFDSNTSALII